MGVVEGEGQDSLCGRASSQVGFQKISKCSTDGQGFSCNKGMFIPGVYMGQRVLVKK